MIKVGHTPGPWHPLRVRQDRIDIATSDPKTEKPNGRVASIHCVAWCNDGQHSADARLIAAAPDLLEACKAVSNLTLDYEEGSTGGNAIVKLRAAISKAEGCL